MLDILQTVISNGLLVDEIKHGIMAIPFALVYFHYTKSVKKLFLFFLTVYLIDLDHFVDFWLFSGISFNLNDFFSLDYFKISNRALVVFHAWEWVLLLGLLSHHSKKGWHSVYTLLAFALLAHMSWDIFTVESISFYSILYRYANNFSIH